MISYHIIAFQRNFETKQIVNQMEIIDGAYDVSRRLNAEMTVESFFHKEFTLLESQGFLDLQ